MKKVYLIVSIMFLVSTGIILTACSSDDDSSTTYSEADLQFLMKNFLNGLKNGCKRKPRL